ncbi:MAG: ABC transporter permease [Anaerolineales bacterium]|nr:ABC transporter permease [Anaerolineales bacterium]MCK5635641.1 ABC transporter permease [Anaerolineales bacterium]
MRIKFEPRMVVPWWLRLIGTIAAILVALAFGAILLNAGGLNPLIAYRQMLKVGFLEPYSVSDTLVKATPLLLVALGLTVAFRMRQWNIGAEGQLLIGAWASAAVALFILPPETPRLIMLSAMVMAGFLGGAVWAFIPGILKAKLNVNEIITSLMLTYVAALFIKYFVYGPWSVGGFPLTGQFPKSAWMPRLLDLIDAFPIFRGMTAHLGFIIGVIIAIILQWIFVRGKWGYQIKVIGDNPEAARYAGMNLSRNIILVMVISGGIAGLAGMSEVSGVIHRLQEHISPGYGFTGIIVAWLARLNPLLVVVVSYLFGGLLVGGDAIQPAGIPLLIQGFLMFCVISADLIVSYRIRIFKPKKVETSGEPVEVTHGT